MNAEALVHDYLSRLDAAAAGSLTPNRRTELEGEVRQHIEMALAEAGARDEVTVRNVLERLGTPDEIIAAEQGAVASPGSANVAALPAAVRGSTWGAVEIAAILLLTLGAVFLPIIGPLLGLIFVWASAQWTSRQKLIATGIVVALAIMPILLLLGAQAGSSPPRTAP